MTNAPSVDNSSDSIDDSKGLALWKVEDTVSEDTNGKGIELFKANEKGMALFSTNETTIDPPIVSTPEIISIEVDASDELIHFPPAGDISFVDLQKPVMEPPLKVTAPPIGAFVPARIEAVENVEVPVVLPVAPPAAKAPERAVLTKSVEPQQSSTESFRALPESGTPIGDEEEGVGVRVMKIKPLWLIASGTLFVSIIVFGSSLNPFRHSEQIAASATRVNDTKPAIIAAKPGLPNVVKASSASVNELAPKKEANAQEASAQIIDAPKNTNNPSPIKPIENKAEPVAVAANAAPVAAAPAQQTKASVPTAPPPPSTNKKGGFTAQIGSYNEASQANERYATLRGAGFDAHVVKADIPKRGTWYRVQCGNFNNRKEAEQYGAQMKAKGVVKDVIVTEAQ